MLLGSTWLGIVALGTITALHGPADTNNIENVTQHLPCGDYISFVNTSEQIWTLLGSKQMYENITCQLDYNFEVINATSITFVRKFIPNNTQKVEEQDHLVVIQISKSNVTLRSTVKDYQKLPADIKLGLFDMVFTHVGFEILLYKSENNSCGVFYVKQLQHENNEESDFWCELRVREWALNKPPEEGCLQHYRDYCTNRRKGPNVTLYNSDCTKKYEEKMTPAQRIPTPLLF